MPTQTANPIPSQPNAPQACAVQQGEAVAQIQEPSPAPKNGYFDGDDDDEDGTPVFQSAEEVIRRSAEVRELRAGDVICIVQLVNDEHANEQHARLTSIDDPDAETVLAWEFITAEEAKEAKAPLAAVQHGVLRIQANCYSDNDGDSWRDCPDDRDFVEGLKVGDTFELQASVRSWSETFRVTKAPDGTSDDYEVELVSSDAPLAAHPTQQGPRHGDYASDLKKEGPLVITLENVNDGKQWCATTNHYDFIVIGQNSAQDALSIALKQALATHPTQQGLDARELPAMTPELASILGLMCFQCRPFAQALRAGGQQIDTRAEDEQAAVLHWMLGHYFRHGEAWRDAAAEDMERMKADAIAAQAKQGEQA